MEERGSPCDRKYKKTFPLVFGTLQLAFGVLSLVLAIAIAIVDTQYHLNFELREYGIICGGWPAYMLVGIVGIVVSRKERMKLYWLYLVLSILTVLGGVIQAIACISERSTYCPAKEDIFHPLLSHKDCQYKEYLVKYIDTLDQDLIASVKKSKEIISIVFSLGAALNLFQYVIGLCVLSAFHDDYVAVERTDQWGGLEKTNKSDEIELTKFRKTTDVN
ncbi:uncharacterized protein [Amphiura filiformis]|uniref:uncharacterized protein n=1 Tax=Amphiura filiformis TaxID=82378 RepID=UPI003B224C03